MTLTVRPDEQESAIIQKAADSLGVKSKSKAMILACSEMLKLKEQVASIERKLYTQTRRAENAEGVINTMQKANHALMTYGLSKE